MNSVHFLLTPLQGRSTKHIPNGGAAMDPSLQQLAQRMQAVTGHVAAWDTSADGVGGQVGGRRLGGVTQGGAAEEATPVPLPGVLHEVTLDLPAGGGGRSGWLAPGALLLDWSARAMGGQGHGGVRWRVWVGRAVWPYPRVMLRRGLEENKSAQRGETPAVTLLERSLFVEANAGQEGGGGDRSADVRVWAIELALACPAVAAVIADGSGFSLAATRRLQLAARRSPAVVILARPMWERDVPSAAGARWRVRPAVSPISRPRWVVELTRLKGATADRRRRAWLLEWNHETSAVCVPADLGHGSGEASTQARAAPDPGVRRIA